MSAKKLPKHLRELFPDQTMIERLTKDELTWLSGFLSKKGAGSAAKVWTLKNACEKEMERRGMAIPPPRTQGEEEFKKTMQLLMHWNGAGMADSVKGEKLAMVKFDDPAFVSAMRACHGVNEFFGDQAQEALEKRDKGFFRSTMEAVEAFAKGRRSSPKESNRMALHIRVGHAVAFRLIKEGKPDPTIQEFEKMVTNELDSIGAVTFEDEKSWRKVRDNCGMAHLKQAFIGRNPIKKGGKRRK